MMLVASITAAQLAGLITAAGTSGAAVMASITAWRRRRDDAERAETEEDSVVITQAQGANLILDATVKAINTQLDRERERADRAQARVEHLESRLDLIEAERETLQRSLDVCRGQLSDLRRGG